MKVAELVENLTQQGVQLWVDNDKLKLQSAKGTLTPELRAELMQRKAEILTFLQGSASDAEETETSNAESLSLQTLGRLISGHCDSTTSNKFVPPLITPVAMAQKLKVTFRPLPHNYRKKSIIEFRNRLEQKLKEYGVDIQNWEQATKEIDYEIQIPLTTLKKTVKTRVVNAGINAVIDVERQPSLIGQLKIWLIERIYGFYSRFVWKQQKVSVATIMQFLGWVEENIQPLQDPTNTQTIVLTDLNEAYIDPALPYQKKIPLGVDTLVRTFSEIVIGVSPERISILNMNLSDSVFSADSIDHFVLNSLIPKIYVPILPLPLSRFEVSQYDPCQSSYAQSLVQLGHAIATTELLPSGFKIDDIIRRKSLRDIVDWMSNGRTGVSYGFVAYAEPPQYTGAIEISESEWQSLAAVPGFNPSELRQNAIGRRYIQLRINQKTVFKQIPDVWIVSSRSGSNKTNLSLETDILRIGLTPGLQLQVPQGVDLATGDIKPSYDLYVMVAIALATALFAPKLIEHGAPMVHFHGYPSTKWFAANEFCAGVHNPSVPCGTYESGVFNFLSIQNLVNHEGNEIQLASLIEPDHGTNIIARDLEYLITRLKTGTDEGLIELGGKYFPSLKTSPSTY